MNDGTESGRPPGALPWGYGRGEHVEPIPVWVALDRVHPEPTDERVADRASGRAAEQVTRAGFVDGDGRAPPPAQQVGRLDLTGEVIGRLYRWERTVDGRWFGVVDYSVPLIDDLRPAKRVTLGLVPAAALRRREVHREPRR